MAKIQEVGAYQAGGVGTTLVITIASTTAGSTLLVFVGNEARSVTGIADNKAGGSQTYENAWRRQNYANGSTCWYVSNCASGVTQITITYSVTDAHNAIVIEEDDLHLTQPLDIHRETYEGTGNTSWSTGTSSLTTQADEVAFVMVVTASGNYTFTNTDEGSPWTDVSGTGITNGHVSGDATMAMWRADLKGRSTYSCAGTVTSSIPWMATICTFKRPSAATPLLQHKTKQISGVNNTTLAFDQNVTAGNTLIASMFFWTSTNDLTCTTPTDTLSNTYDDLFTQINASANHHMKMWTVASSTGGACTVTFDISGATTGEIVCQIAEYRGVVTIGTPVTNSGYSTTPSAGNITPSKNNCLVHAFVGAGNNDYNIPLTSLDWMKIDQAPGSSSVSGASAMIAQKTAAQVNATWSTPATDYWAAAAVTLEFRVFPTQSDQSSVTGVESTDLAFPVNVTAGNYLVASMWFRTTETGKTAGTPTDTIGHTWLPVLDEQTVAGTNQHHMRSWYCVAASSAANTVTFTITTTSSSEEIDVVVSEWANAAALGSVTTNAGNGTSVSTGNVTPYSDNSALIAVAGHRENAPTITHTATPEFDILEELTPAGMIGMTVDYSLQSTAAQDECTWTWSGINDWLAHIFILEASASAPQTAAPTSDISAGSWSPSTGSTLYEVLDEASPGTDSDYISSSTNSDTAKVKFGAVTDPVSSSGHKLYYRVRATTTDQITAYVYQGTTLIATDTTRAPGSTETTYTLTLSGAEADSITDYSDIRAWFTTGTHAGATSTAAQFPTVASDASETTYNGYTWSNISNITADDTSYATIIHPSFDNGVYSYVAYAKGFDFSAIPDGSTITGVECIASTWYDAGTAVGALAQLLSDTGVRGGTNMWASETDALSGTVGSTKTIGGAGQTWGNSLTAAWVKDADFGVAIALKATSNNTDVSIDYVTLKIYYTPPAADWRVTWTQWEVPAAAGAYMALIAWTTA